VMRLSQEEVKPKPGSWVNTPWSLDNVLISRTSGPIVPDLTGNWLFVPVAGLISSKFLSAMAAIPELVAEAYTLLPPNAQPDYSTILMYSPTGRGLPG